jgi:hypothetical protein
MATAFFVELCVTCLSINTIALNVMWASFPRWPQCCVQVCVVHPWQWGKMAAACVVCRSNVLLVFDISRAFSLSCFVGGGPCNKVKMNHLLFYFPVG